MGHTRNHLPFGRSIYSASSAGFFFFTSKSRVRQSSPPARPTMSRKVSKIMTQPINLIFRFLTKQKRVQIWLFENKNTRLEGVIVGFDEYMNLVLQDVEEVHVRKDKAGEDDARRALGRILLKGDNVALIRALPEDDE